MDQGKWHSLHKAPFCPHRQMNFSRGKIHLGYAIFLDKLARYGIKVLEELFGDLWGNIHRGSQTSNNRNIPFIRKRNIWPGYLVAWMRWITGMALARVGIKGHLSMES